MTNKSQKKISRIYKNTENGLNANNTEFSYRSLIIPQNIMPRAVQERMSHQEIYYVRYISVQLVYNYHIYIYIETIIPF